MILTHASYAARSCGPLAAVLAAWLVASSASAAEAPAAATYDVREFGARGDGESLDTAAIQKAIDACAAAGGGEVRLAGGTFLSGTVVLKSHVTLHVAAGATLLGSRDMDHYPDLTPKIHYLYRPRFTKALIYAEQAECIGIAGRGTIDGQGHFYTNPDGDKLRPYILRFSECKNVRVAGVKFLNSARWLSHYLACEDVVIDGVTIDSRIRANRDGIDVDSCRNVRIANCHVFTGDDAIVLKATAHRPCEHVTVTNCVLSSQASAFKLGTESNGGFEDITVSNCTIHDTGRAGIAILMVDGAALERVNVSNITMRDVGTAVVVRLGNRARPLPGEDPPGVGSLEDVMISNIQGENIGPHGCFVCGIPGHPVRNVTLENIRLRFAGGVQETVAVADVPEREAAYPGTPMFGTLPAYGFFCRHAENVRLHNLDLEFVKDDVRPAIVCDDVAELDLFSLRAKTTKQTGAVVSLHNVRGAMLHGCRVHRPIECFVKVHGKTSSHIALIGNDLRNARQTVTGSRELAAEAVIEE